MLSCILQRTDLIIDFVSTINMLLLVNSIKNVCLERSGIPFWFYVLFSLPLCFNTRDIDGLIRCFAYWDQYTTIARNITFHTHQLWNIIKRRTIKILVIDKTTFVACKGCTIKDENVIIRKKYSMFFLIFLLHYSSRWHLQIYIRTADLQYKIQVLIALEFFLSCF